MKSHRTRWAVLASGLLLALVAGAAPPGHGEVWGKRVWDREVEGNRRLVVDERGSDEGMTGLHYCWRLLQAGKTDGPVLFDRRGVQMGSGTGRLFERVEVLYGDVMGRDVVTVFNQREQCWAFVLHQNEDGSVTPTPDAQPWTSELGPAAKSAEVKQRAGGAFELVVTDEAGRRSRFELRRDERDPKRSRWVEVKSSATAPVRK